MPSATRPSGRESAPRPKSAKAPKLSRTHAPEHLSSADWQRAPHRQFGREQAFGLEQLGAEPFFSEFRVSNPESWTSYRVVIRGVRPGDNYCACPDYASNELGTCKHIEFTPAALESKRGARKALAAGYLPAFSELYLRNGLDGEGRAVHFRAGRCLLGDEMGLDKTIQAIAAAEILAKLCGVTRVLVICPTSLKYQWQQEIGRFSGRRDENAARVIAGGRAQRQKDYAEDDFCKITNCEKLKPDLDLSAAWAPELVIVDAAQRVKNWNTIAARALKRIDSPDAVVLTGTPLENKLEELISIVQFVDQHRLGPTWKLLHQHQVKDEAGRVTGYTALEQIGATLAPIMLRRRKSEVLRQLPERTDQNLRVPMTEAQMRYHDENADIVARIVKRWRKTRFLSDQDQRRLTCALLNMLMSCNSTYLLDQESDHGVKADELAALFDELLVQPEATAPGIAPPAAPVDPWGALLQLGAQFAAALGVLGEADHGRSSHPWIERDPQTGARNLKLPLPPPETARQIAAALSLMAQALRGNGS